MQTDADHQDDSLVANTAEFATTTTTSEEAISQSEPTGIPPPLSELMIPSHYAEYDGFRREYRLKVDIKTPNSINDTLCVPWEVNGDYWWTHNRDWEMGNENETHYCYRKILDPVKARYFRQLYHIQFGHIRGKNPEDVHHCDHLIVKRMWQSGWGADLMNVVDGLHHAFKNARPFQIQESTTWHYASTKKSVDKSKPPKVACPEKNMYCYLLNMTDCRSSDTTRSTADSPTKPYLEDTNALYYTDRYRWYIEWLVRPQTWLRKRVYDYIQQEAPQIETPCTAIHVRRNDVVLHDQQARKYHSIKEYIDAAKGTVRPNILLMTDDHNAIGEATTLSPDYHWMYLDRPRFRGVGGWEHQIPSDDPVLEVVVLFALFKLVRKCDQFIMSVGKFSDYLYQEMIWNRKPDDQVDLIDIDYQMDFDKDIMNAANYKTHAVSKNYDPEDLTADKMKKMITSGGKRFVGEPIPRDKEFNGEFCQTWDIDADEWWTHHPKWEMGKENGTHYCFQPILDAEKANFLHDLYTVQFEGNCNRVFTKRMWSSGWGADLENVLDGLYHAIKKRVPFQVGTERWHYADAGLKEQEKEGSIACPKRNMFCYFLELSRCKPRRSWEGQWLEDPFKGGLEYIWMHDYATRPQTWLRKRIFDFIQKQEQEYFRGECAAIHVRRGDVVYHGDLSRKYHAIKDYMDYAKQKNVTLHKNILLLSDDLNAFAEARTNFPEYNWMQIDRPRKESKDAKWEQHLVTNDPIFEMVVIQSIFQMVKKCDQFVFSSSNFADHIKWAMDPNDSNHAMLNIDAGKDASEVRNSNNMATRGISKRTGFTSKRIRLR